MTQQEKIRDEFLQTLGHLRSVLTKVRNESGIRKALSFPDAHKISEGLLLSAWTHWEELVRSLFVVDLASVRRGVLLSEVKVQGFRTKNAPMRLARRILSPPDAEKWTDWSQYTDVRKRADELLGKGSRFSSVTKPTGADLEQMKRIRNAVAHRSDRAWESFIDLVSNSPFSLTPAQRKGITPGRFLFAHRWNGGFVLEECLGILEIAARALVP